MYSETKTKNIMTALQISKEIAKTRTLLNKHNFKNNWFKKEFEKEAENKLTEIDDKLSELLTSLMIENKLTIQDVYNQF